MNGHDDDRFDRTARVLHRDSLAHLAPDTLRRLRDARTAAAPPPSRRIAWPFASAVAAVFVLAIALPLRSPSPSPPRPDAERAREPATARREPAERPAPPGGVAAHDAPAMLVVVDESPDFFLWLASSEAAIDATE